MTQNIDIKKINEIPTQKLPLGKIDFDKENPRIQMLIDSFVARGWEEKDINQDQLRLGQRTATSNTYEALMQSIEVNGLLEPIWVYEKKGRYVVIEGNTRKLVFDALAEKYPDNLEWKSINARIFPEGTPEDTIAFIRLESHLGGKQPWRPYERARYLYYLLKKGYEYKRLSSETRRSETEIKKDIQAFELMRDKFMTKYGDKVADPVGKYNYFVELISKKKVRNLVTSGEFTVEDFSKWVAEGKIPMAIYVRKLPKIFADQEVARVFKDKGYEMAIEVLSTIKPDVASQLFSDVESVIEQLNELTNGEINEIRDKESAKKSMLKKLISKAEFVIGKK
jgi:hypothetical protein